MSIRLEVTSSPGAADRDVIHAGLKSFNRAQGGVPASEPLAVLARDPDGGVVGGLIGRTIAAWLFVELFWLPESVRGSGLGARTIGAAEAEALRRGCLGVHLDTFSFQAPRFYRRLGYEVFGVIDDHPPGHKRYFLRKRFVGSAADRPIVG